MESVLAKSSSHGHTAQIQQSPGDTWEAMGRNGEKEERLIPLLTLRSKGWLCLTGTDAHCQLPNFRARSMSRGEKGLATCSFCLQKQGNPHYLGHLLADSISTTVFNSPHREVRADH